MSAPRHEIGSRIARATILTLTLCAAPPPARPQGCAQCRDNTAATPPATQRAFRHAIALLVLAGGTVFTATLLLFKKLDQA